MIEEKDKWKYVPGLSIFGTIVFILFIVISFMSWGGIPPRDLSQLIFGIGFSFLILFGSYYYWMRKLDDIEKQEIREDIQAIDKKCNGLENKLIINSNRTERR